MENKIESKENYFRLRKPIMISAIILIIGIFAVYFMMGNITSNAVKEQKKSNEEYQNWLADNCKCTERNSTICGSGYELKGNTCVNETLKTFTNVLKACSKYYCSGTNVTLNNQTWEPKLNFNSSKQ